MPDTTDPQTMTEATATQGSGRGSRYLDEEIDYIVDVIRNADPLTQGKQQDLFEERFREVIGVNHAFAMTSCTSALHIAAVLSKVGPGDEVIIPAHTFAASAIPFAHTGATIVWADIEPDTFVTSADCIRRKITSKTKVILVVHLYGLMVDMDPVMALAEEHDLIVVEDAAQALGSTINGRAAGSYGHFACFSFHGHKNVTTLGEGGMLVVRDDETAALIPGVRHNGMRAFEGEREFYWEPAMTNVDFDITGMWPFNYCLSEPQCAAGYMQLGRLDAISQVRIDRAARLREALAEFPEITFQAEKDGFKNVHYCVPARFKSHRNTVNRNDLMSRLADVHDVKMIIQYMPLYRYPIFAKAGFGESDCPECDDFYDSQVSFPFHAWMPEDQFNHMLNATVESLTYLRDAEN